MDTHLIVSNLLNPPVLFFFLGAFACLVGSDLEIPQPLPKFFSLYLLVSIGFKGGVELGKSGFTAQVAVTLAAAMGMAVLVPAVTFFILRRKMDVFNAAAVAATYGSISAVTFIAATSFLGLLNLKYSGHMIAAMALMESPAIVVGIAMARLLNHSRNEKFSWSHLLRDAFLNGSVLLLVGSLVIGIVTGESGGKALSPFTADIFKGMLCLFLLDMGIISARRLAGIRQLGIFPVGFAIAVPLCNAAIAIALARFIQLDRGDALLFTILCASASYIAVPAAMRMAVPEANPGLYVTMALALTFPFNILIGMPIYMSVINHFWN
ncbi:MAG: sodium-dependent bicarbonate transport family permease [Verrucomicrobiota bacterium]